MYRNGVKSVANKNGNALTVPIASETSKGRAKDKRYDWPDFIMRTLPHRGL